MKKVPKVLQEERMDCGAACLYSILKYHQGNIRYQKLKQMVQVNENGVSAYALLKVGEFLGFKTEGKKGEITQIQEDEFPCIAHIKRQGFYHFVVLMGYNLSQEKVFIMDPSKGYDNVSITYWKEICTENYLFFKVKRFLINEKTKSPLPFIFPKEMFSKTFLKLLICSLFYSILEIFSLLDTKIFVTYLLTKKDMTNLFHFISFFFGFYLLIHFGLFILQWSFLKLQNQIFLDQMKKWFYHLLNLPYDSFERQKNHTYLSLTETLEDLYSYFSSCLETLVLDVPLFFISFLFLLQKNFYFSLGLIVCLTIFLIISCLLSNKLTKEIKKSVLKKDRRDLILLDSLGRLEITKGLHLERFLGRKLVKNQIAYQEAHYNFSICYEERNFLKQVFLKGFEMFFLIYFFISFYQHKVTLYSYFLLHLFFEFLLNSSQKISEIFFLFPKARDEIRRVSEVLLMEEEFFPRRSILPFKHFTKLEILAFSYRSEGVLIPFSFSCQINSKDKVLLHGPSGSGKSTLCKSILKLTPTLKNQIFLNGIDVCYLNLEDLRKRICYVSQEEGLFTGTLLENITLGKRVFQQKLKQVLDLTHVSEILKKKQVTLDFAISTRMIPFSGGERKKILLARTLLIDKDIYLLDEVFESIEQDEAKELIQNVLNYLKEKIVLVVSHRQEIDFLFQQVLTLEDKK